MPRHTCSNNQAKEPRRPLRRSSRLQTNNSEDTAALRPSETQATPTASAVAPSASSTLQAAPSGNTSSSSRQLPPLGAKSNLTLRTRGRKRDPSDNDDRTSRKKGRSSSTARVSLDTANDDASRGSNRLSEASPNVHVKYSSTITPVCSIQSRSRTEDEEGMSTSQASLLGNNNEESRSSTSSALSSSSTTPREPQATLPEGVVDLYPSEKDTMKVGTCKHNFCATKSLTQAFLSSYGHDYYQILKDQEHDDASSETCSTNHTHSSDAESLSLSSSPRNSHHHHAAAPSLNRPVLGSSPHVGDLETLDRQPHLSAKMRAVLMDWLIELSEEYRFGAQTLQLAVALVDQSLACGAPGLAEEGESGFFTVKREMLQCVGCACAWIASKMEEVEPPCAMDFVYISDNSYTKEQIADMELTVCTALEFRLSQVTPFHFIHEFLRASCACGDPSCCAPENPLLKHMVLYLVELSLLPNELAYTNASLKAAAAVYVARVTLGIRSGADGYWSVTLAHYTGYELADLEETAMTIHRYHRAAEESQLRSCFVKFSKEKYSKVSLKTVPLESDFGF